MNNTRLYINNELLDVSKSIETLFDYSVIDIRNTKERSNAVSYLIELDATDKVRRVFGFPDYITSKDAIRLSKKYTARLESSSTLISGRVKFSKVKIVDNKTVFEFYIIGNSGNWANDLIELMLWDLDFWDYSHPWTQTSQESAEVPNAIKPYIYPVINSDFLGVFYVHKAILANSNKTEFIINGEVFPNDFSNKDILIFRFEEDTYNILENSFTVTNDYDGKGNSKILCDNIQFVADGYGYIEIVGRNNRLRVTDRYPVINVAEVFQRIFLGIGFKIESNFLNNILSKKYIAHEQFTGFDGQLRFEDNFKFRAGINEDKVVSNGTSSTAEYIIEFDNVDYQTNFDNTNSFEVSNHLYNPRAALTQTFYFALRFTVTKSMVLQFFVVVEDASGNKSYQNGVGTATYTGTHYIETTTFSYMEIPITSKVYIIVRYLSSDGDITFLKGACRFENRLRFIPKSEGDTIHLMRFLPQWSQLEFITSIIRNFELIVMTDLEKRVIYIEDYDKFYDYSNVISWEDKVDASKELEIFEIMDEKGKNTRYKYKQDDNDFQLTYLKNIFNIDYGSSVVSNNSQFKGKETDEIEFDFSATFMDFIGQIGLNELKLPKIRLIEKFEGHGVRILHYDGLKTLSSDTWKQGSTTRTNVPHLFFFDDENVNMNSLNMDDQVNCVGLVTKHFQQFINEVEQSKLLSGYIYFSPYDIAGFNNVNSLRRDYRSIYKIRLRNELILARINKISKYDPNDVGSTYTEFVQILSKRFLPIYQIPIFEFYEITSSFNLEAEELTITVKVKNIGGVTGTTSVSFNYRGTEQTESKQLYSGEIDTLSVTFEVTAIVFGGGLTINVSSLPGRVEWIYFGKDFVKSYFFQY